MALTPVTMTGAGKDTIKEGFLAVNQIIDDLASTASGAGASCIGVRDTAGNLAASNVEDALAEIYTDVFGTTNMSIVFDEDETTTTGLTWGYKAGNLRYNNVITAVAAGTISLTDDATNYVELASDGTVSANTTGFTSGRIPLRQVVCAAGAQTTSTDKRGWFAIDSLALAIDTDATMAANSDTKVASQKATKTYADLKLAKASNLSDVASASTARANLGIQAKYISDYADLAAAITAIGSTSCTLVIDANATVAADLAFPATLFVCVLRGAVITVATGTTLTINGGFQAGPYPVFTLQGTGAVSLRRACPEWFGAAADGATNDLTAISAAMTAVAAQYGTVFFSPGRTYAIQDGYVQVPNGVWAIDGNRAQVKALTSTASVGFLLKGVHFGAASNVKYLHFRDLIIDLNGQSGVGIYGDCFSHCRICNNDVLNIKDATSVHGIINYVYTDSGESAIGNKIFFNRIVHNGVQVSSTGISLWSEIDYSATPADIQGLSRAAACVVTHTGHGFAAGDSTGNAVTFSGITQADWTALNGNTYAVTVIDANSFSIPVNTSGYAADYAPGTDPGKITLIPTGTSYWIANHALKTPPYQHLDTNVFGNEITKGYYGLDFQTVSGCQIAQNTCRQNVRGMHIRQSSNYNNILGNILIDSSSSSIHLSFGASMNNIAANNILNTVSNGGEGLLQAYIACSWNRFEENNVYATVLPDYHIYCAIQSNGNTFKNNTLRGTAGKAYIAIESAWNGDCAIPAHRVYGMATYPDGYASVATTGIALEGNMIYNESNVPVFFLSQVTDDATGNIAMTNIALKNNTVWLNSTSYQLQIYEENSGSINNLVLQNNDWVYNAVAADFSLTRGRAHFRECSGNSPAFVEGVSGKVSSTASVTLSGASGSIAVNVPLGARILGVQLRVDTAITSGDGATSWSAAYVNTPTTAICSGKAFTKNTKYSAIHGAHEITTGVATITITPNSGTFSGGVVTGTVYYEKVESMLDAA